MPGGPAQPDQHVGGASHDRRLGPGHAGLGQLERVPEGALGVAEPSQRQLHVGKGERAAQHVGDVIGAGQRLLRRLCTPGAQRRRRPWPSDARPASPAAARSMSARPLRRQGSWRPARGRRLRAGLLRRGPDRPSTSRPRRPPAPARRGLRQPAPRWAESSICSMSRNRPATSAKSLLAMSPPTSPMARTGRLPRTSPGKLVGPAAQNALTPLAAQVGDGELDQRRRPAFVSPASRACRTAASGCPASAYQALALRCSSGNGLRPLLRAGAPAARRRTGGGSGTSAAGRPGAPRTGCAVRGTPASACPPVVAVTASQSGPLSRSRIEVLSRKSRTSAGCLAEDLVDEVVDDVAVVAGEPGDEPRRVVAVPQRDRGQLQGRDPALGAVAPGPPRRSRRGTRPVAVVEVRRRLVVGEAEVGRTDLDQLTAGAQPGQGKGGIGAGADDQPQLGREVLEQERHVGPDRRARRRGGSRRGRGPRRRGAR